MGREVKRVPLDFDWPMNTIWKGYVNPYQATQCKACDGTGYNRETKRLHDEWYSSDKAEWVYSEDRSRRYNALSWSNNIDEDDIEVLVKKGRLWDFTRVPITEEHKKIVEEKIANGGNSWLPFDNGYIPTPEEVNEWNRWGLGHCSSSCYICVKAKAKRLGVYGKCSVCGGYGDYYSDEKYRNLAEEWERVDPPKGDGWQMWETTSEGSAISPVCETPEELARWLADNGASSFGKMGATYEQWLGMIKESGWAPGAIMDSNGLRSGVEAMAEGASGEE